MLYAYTNWPAEKRTVLNTVDDYVVAHIDWHYFISVAYTKQKKKKIVFK